MCMFVCTCVLYARVHGVCVVCTCAWPYQCVYVVCVAASGSADSPVKVRVHACMDGCCIECMYGCINVCSMHVCMHICLDLWMHACMHSHACMYACMYGWVDVDHSLTEEHVSLRVGSPVSVEAWPPELTPHLRAAQGEVKTVGGSAKKGKAKAS